MRIACILLLLKYGGAEAGVHCVERLDLPALTMYVSINSDELAGVAVSWRDVGL